MLVCPVRGCRRPLQRDQRRWICERGHSFDVARSGYVNLLQPQDKRSKQPGDSTEAAAARRRLHDRGVTQPLLRALMDFSGATPLDVVLDAGCGEGFYIGRMQEVAGCQAHGVDLSIPAINLAARRFPNCHWVVANADRFVPYSDQSFSFVSSITARVNSPEFRRVLRPGGRLVVALPAPDDLVEIRGAGRDRVGRTVDTFNPDFRLTRRAHASTVAALDAEGVHDLLRSIYRPMQSKPIEAASVTFSLDLLLFEPR